MSGYMVGIIGVSSNPTSGLTVSVLIIVAFIMVLMGQQGASGISAVLIVAAFTCASVSVAGEMMQDLKAGHILGCTPWRMQLGDVFGVTAASLVMFFVLSVLHLGNIKQTVAAKLSELEGEGVTEVVYDGRQQKIPAGTYTLDEIKVMIPEWQNEILQANAGFGGELKERVTNTGTLLASGLIAGEALVGILFATLAFAEIEFFKAFEQPSYLIGLVGLLAVGAFLVVRALGAAGRKEPQ